MHTFKEYNHLTKRYRAREAFSCMNCTIVFIKSIKVTQNVFVTHGFIGSVVLISKYNTK